MIEKKWVYLSLDGSDFTLNVKPTTYESVPDGKGGIIYHKTVKPINLLFVRGKAVVDEALAKYHKLPVEVIVNMVEGQPSFGKTFFLAQSPEKLPNEETLRKIEAADKISEEKSNRIIRGVRATKNA